MSLSAGQEWRLKIQNRLIDTVGEGEGGTNWESSTEIYTLPCVEQMANGESPYSTGGPVWCSVTTERGGGGWGGREGGREGRAGVWQKPTQRYKVITLQLEINK